MPTDVNPVEAEPTTAGGSEKSWTEEEWMSYGTTELDAVNKDTKCYACQGFGHYARDCKYDKKKIGGGKGEKGKGKGKGGGKGYFGKGKGGGKGNPGYQGKGKGGGKGYQGKCWNCDRVGHKSAECWSQKKVQAVEETSGDIVNVGSVWNVAVVECSNKYSELEDEESEGPCDLVDSSSDGGDPRVIEEEEEESESEEESDLFRFEWIPPAPKATECCSGGWCEQKRKRPRKKKNKWQGEWKECGEPVWVCPVEDESKKDKCMGLNFQVADVKKPLIAVKRITEKGNFVSFGPEKDDNYILNKKTGDKMMLKPSGRGSYVMEVSFLGGEKTNITVDSGAEENVCPWEWGEKLFGTKDADQLMAFRGAKGDPIEHWGKREVKVISPF